MWTDIFLSMALYVVPLAVVPFVIRRQPSARRVAVLALFVAPLIGAATYFNNIDTSRTTQLAMGVTDNAFKAFTTRKIAATLLAPPYAEELEAKGYNKLAEARAYAPLSFIGLVSSTETVKKSPLKVQAMIAGLYRTMIYIHNPVNRDEVIQYIARYHSIDLGLAEKAFTAQMLSYSKDGTKPRKAVEREIEIYREILKITKTFTPDDLEDMSLLKKIQERAAAQGR
jgi:ABC-type nitrate/sulfonate/bicarbonate transport system substrate-binding protein